MVNIFADFNEIVALVTVICGLIGAVAALIPTVIKLFKTIKELVKTKNWNVLKTAAKAAMQEVEEYSREHPEMTSEEKLDMAIETIQKASITLGVEITDEVIENLITYIEETIKWVNKMNK